MRSSIKTKRKNAFLPLLVGLLLRLAYLNKHEFWFDEKVSLLIARQSLPSLLSASATTNAPPFYFLILKFWSSISDDILFIRLLSLIFGILTILVSYKVFNKLTNERVAFLASFLLALSPLNIYYSTEIRMYSLLVLEALLLIWLFLRFIETKKKIFLFFIFLTGSISLHTHYYAFLLILSLNIAFFQFKKYRSQAGAWLISQALIVLSNLPWFLSALKISRLDCWCFNPLVGVPSTIASFVVGGMGIVTLKDYIFFAPKVSLWIFSFAVVFITLIFFVGSWKAKLAKNSNLLIFFFTPIIAATLFSFFYPVFSPRALIISSPYFYLLVSLGINSYKLRSDKNVVSAITLGLLVLVLIVQFANPFFAELPTYKEYLQSSPLFQ